MSQNCVKIIGGGLAGSEAAWQLVERGIAVRLCEMRPVLMTKAHKTERLAELVCSNSFRGAALTNAVGLLKEELRQSNSLIMRAADACAVPAGGALAVDRELFSAYIDQALQQHPLISIERAEVQSVPPASREEPVIIATGPLTSAALSKSIQELTGADSLAFFDAISPIILFESLDTSQIFKQSRYEKGEGDDYWNIPLSKEEYYCFVDEIAKAEKFGGHEEVEADMVDNLRPFEGCMPIEEMVERGPNTLRFGPLKPVGLTDPRTGTRSYAVMQLRQDDREGNLWSMVGMQTRMRHGEQLRIFRSLPGLAQAEFVRLGTVHRNTFIDSPKVLNGTLEMRKQRGLFFAGQVTGTEGYVESTAGGLVAGINAARVIQGLEPAAFPKDTAIGSLVGYVSDETRKNFQPMNISFGLMQSYLAIPKERNVSKDERRLKASEQALRSLREFMRDK